MWMGSGGHLPLSAVLQQLINFSWSRNLQTVKLHWFWSLNHMPRSAPWAHFRTPSIRTLLALAGVPNWALFVILSSVSWMAETAISVKGSIWYILPSLKPVDCVYYSLTSVMMDFHAFLDLDSRLSRQSRQKSSRPPPPQEMILHWIMHQTTHMSMLLA